MSWAKIKHWLGFRTVEEAFQDGKDTADKLLLEGVMSGKSSRQVADYIYAMGFGGFNESPTDRAFDRGIQARLSELGFEDPNW